MTLNRLKIIILIKGYETTQGPESHLFQAPTLEGILHLL